MNNKIKLEYLKKLVIDTIVWRLDTKTALDYIEKIGKKKISERYYFKIKKQVLSNDEVDNWIRDHMRFGLLLTHKMDIEELDRIKNPLLEIYFHETSQSYMIPDSEGTLDIHGNPLLIKNPNYDANLVMKLSSHLMDVTKILSDSYASNPVILTIQERMKKDMQVPNLNKSIMS